MASYPRRSIPVPEGKGKEKRRSFLPAPKTFTAQKETLTQEPRIFSPPPEDHANEELHVGDRVVISGIKSGTLLYFGKTHIAPGFWCGIALDEPDGKHDGSVEGVRYFECLFGHGIFAPVDRVAKLVIPEQDLIEPEAEQIRQLPQPKVRRLLPQPKLYNKQENNANILGSNISDEQEEILYKTERGRLAGLQKSPYQQNLYDRQNLNIDDLMTEQYGDQGAKKLSSTFTLPEKEEISQPIASRLTDYSKQSQKTGKHRSNVSTISELEVAGIALNSTYTLPGDKVELLSRLHNDSGSSGDDSIGPELKECLSSDGRKYFNLTFDTDNSSPKHFHNLINSERHAEEILNEHEVKTTSKSNQMSESMSSSLGVLDLEDVLYQTDLLTEDLVDSSNLTDQEKIVKCCGKTKRIASINDTFENKNVVTSTPLVTDKSQTQLDRTRTILQPTPCMHAGIPEEVEDLSEEQILENFRQNLNSTFQTRSSKDVELPIVGEDTLDWRHEASDSEDQQSDDSLEDSYYVNKNLFPGFNTKGNNLNTTFGVESNNSRLDSLTEKLQNLGINKENSNASIKEQSFQTDQKALIQEQLEKLHKPMIDSGISLKGLVDSTTSLQSSTEGVIYRQRKPMTDSGISLQSDLGMADSQEMRWSQNLDSLQETTETAGLEEKRFGDPSQLARDLQAGHDKRGRPLSIISTTSADTGYVPDTDSEVGTVTMESPTEWIERQEEGKNLDQAYSDTFKHYQAAVLKGTRRARDLESDSDMYSDAGTIIADTDTLISSDIDTVSSSIGDVKANSSDQVCSQDLTKVTPKSKATITFLDENVEDERIEADQQLDLKNQSETGLKSDEKTDIPEVNIEIVDNDAKKDEDVDSNTNNASTRKASKMTPKKKEIEKSEYKKPNVTSRLADYIKQPLPELTEEEKLERAKNRKNKLQKNVVKKEVQEDKNRSQSEEDHKKVEKEPPKVIKRTPPKSKWDAVMNKIESNQNTPTKPKTEVKSKLQTYLSAPLPPKKEPENKIPKKLSNMPTPDYSKVKSKLNIAAPPPVKKQDNASEQGKKKSMLPPPRRHSSLSSNASSSVPKLDLNESVGSSVVFVSALNSARSSCSDLQKEPLQEKSHDKPSNPSVGRLSMPGKGERRDSISSTISNISQGSSKLMNDKNIKLGDRVSLRRKSVPVKSSIPPPTDLPRKTSGAVSARNNLSGTTNKINKPLSNVKDSPTKKDQDSSKNKSKTKNVPKANHKTEPEPKLTLTHAKEEITRLEALCENRTKELNVAKFEMKTCLSGFDAMAALVNYLSNDLNAFSCPKLAAQLQTIQQQLKETQTQSDDLKTHKSRLEQEITDLCSKHEKEKTGIVHDNEKALAAEIVKFTLEKTRALQIAEESHNKVLKQLKVYHDDEISRLRLEHTEDFMKIQLKHKDDIVRLQQKHEGQMEVSWYQLAIWELHKQHRDKLEEITKRFEAMKLNLSDKVETLRTECDELRVRARDSEEMLLRDSDIKVQMAIARYRHMPQEIESLKQVLDMRNEEIFKLRNKNIELGKTVEELNAAKDKILALNQKIENLEAIITLKTDHEKQINEKCQMLMRRYDKESKVNKRLSMDYEELMWKMAQSAEGSVENLLKMGASPPSETDSPVLRRKTVSPVTSEHSPARSPAYRRSVSSNNGEKSQDKKWKRKSASFLYEEKRTSPSRSSPTYRTYLGSDSLPNSPRTKPSGRNNRMSHSCNDAEVFDGPHALPSPVAPPELSSSLDSDYFTSDKTDSSEKDTSATISQSGDSICVTIVEGELKSNGISSPSDGNHDDVSEMSHSTDSCGVSSLVWDYEKFDSSCRSMESSGCRSMESSVASDTVLEVNGNDTSDNCTFSNSSTVEDMTASHSSDKGAELSMSQECILSDINVEAKSQKDDDKLSIVNVHTNGDLPKTKIPTFKGKRESTV